MTLTLTRTRRNELFPSRLENACRAEAFPVYLTEPLHRLLVPASQAHAPSLQAIRVQSFCFAVGVPCLSLPRQHARTSSARRHRITGAGSAQEDPTPTSVDYRRSRWHRSREDFGVGYTPGNRCSPHAPQPSNQPIASSFLDQWRWLFPNFSARPWDLRIHSRSGRACTIQNSLARRRRE